MLICVGNFHIKHLWYRYLLNEEEIEAYKHSLENLFYSIPGETYAHEASDRFSAFRDLVIKLGTQKVRRGEMLLLMEEAIRELMRPELAVQAV